MKILILGADGMLGHKLFQQFLSEGHDVRGTIRGKDVGGLLPYASRLICSCDAFDAGHFEDCIQRIKPDVVVNAVGMIKQRELSPISAITVNSLLPHRLAAACRLSGSYLVQVSTDCVFSGRGTRPEGYVEADLPDPEDLYGRSKLLGEVYDEGAGITLRTSIVGLGLSHKKGFGLIEWFLSQQGPVCGFSRVRYSGLSTQAFGRVLGQILATEPDRRPRGLWHLSSEPVSKLTLLQTLNEMLGTPKTIVPDASVECDRALCSDLLATAFGIRAPGWEEMLRGLADEILSREGAT